MISTPCIGGKKESNFINRGGVSNMNITKMNCNRVRGSNTLKITEYKKLWQGWLDEDRTILSVDGNDILGDF